MVSRPWSSILLPRANKAITLPKEEGLRSQHEDGLVSRELLGVKFSRELSRKPRHDYYSGYNLSYSSEARGNIEPTTILKDFKEFKSLKLTYKGKS